MAPRPWAWPVALLGLGLGLAAPPVLAQKKPPAKPAAQAPAPEFAKLVTDYQKALDDYYKPVEGITDNAKILAALKKLDPKKAPDRLFRPRFESLATGGVDRATRLAAGLQTLQMLLPADKALARRLMDRLIAENLKYPEIERVAAAVQILSYNHGPALAEAGLQRIQRDARAPAGRASALFQLGQLAQGGRPSGGDPGKARAYFTRVQAEYPATRFAKMAERTLFEMDHLAIGKEAPDFEATDENGAKFKLSDYRGKVVVLDFWGFW